MHPQLKSWLDEFKELYPNREILFVYQAGSHFFDLHTENSDLDFRGVYLPSPDEFPGENRRKQHERKTNAVEHTQNSKDDVDFLLFSFTKVLELLKSGDFNVMEMLYCPEEKIIIDTPLMKELREFRSNLMVKDISSFLGFIKKEYRRYGVNINHYGAQLNLLKYLRELKQINGGHTRLKDVWSEIRNFTKDDTMVSFTESLTGNSVYVPSLKIAQRIYQWTVSLDYVIEALDERIERYGHRQKRMAENNKEYKGLYHALRLIYEAQDLYEHGELKLPFSTDRLNTLMSIKRGLLDKEEVHALIDTPLDELFIKEKTLQFDNSGVYHRLDRLLFTYRGRMNLQRVLNSY